MSARAWATQETAVNRFAIARIVSSPVGLGEPRMAEKTWSKPAPSRAGQPVPRHQQVRLCIQEGPLLVLKEIQREPAVQQGVVSPAPHQLAVLVVLDQVVLGIPREGQGIEPQGVHRRHTEQIQSGVDRLQVGQVEGNDVVAEEKIGSLGQPVEFGQRLGKRLPARRKQDRPGVAWPQGSQGAYAAAVLTTSKSSERQRKGCRPLFSVRARMRPLF